MRRIATALVATLLAMTAVGAPPAAAETPALAAGVTQHVTFNDPRSDTGKYRILKELNRAISEAPGGAKVRIVTWRWSYAPSTDVAIDAVRRGVDLRIALNAASLEYSETQRLKNALGSRVVLCRPTSGSGGGCISDRDGGTAHNKIMTLSATGTRKNVVMVTSHNVSTGQTRTYNDNVVTAGDADYYGKMTTYLEHSLAQLKNNDYRAEKGRFSSPGSLTQTWAGPKASSDGRMNEEAATDTLAQLLKAVPGRSGCVVYVPESKIDDTRTAVVVQLVRLKQAGCFVSMLTRMSTDSADDARRRFAEAGIPWKTGDPHQHMKVVIVRGGGVPDFVLHGSEHPTRDFRRNDEILQKNTNPAVVKAYHDWFVVCAKRAGLATAT